MNENSLSVREDLLRGFAPAAIQKIAQFQSGESALLYCVDTSDEELTPTQLSKMLNLSKARISMILKSLTKKGFVVLKESPTDKRVSFVSLTKEGQNVIKGKHAQMDRLLDDLYEKYGEQEMKTCAAVLKDVLEKMKEGDLC